MSPEKLVCSIVLLSTARLFAFVGGIDVESDACGGTLTEMSGEISTPNYPQSYPTNITCTWRIMGGNSHVNMTFLDFQVEASPVCKDFDYLEVGYSYNRRTRICGFQRPWFWVLPVEGNEIELMFKSDASLTRRGFNLTYDKYDINGCLTKNGGCTHNCSFNGGKVICRCEEGYRLSWNGKDCNDINECNRWPRKHDCKTNQICVNTPGSFHCVCKAGYGLKNKTCDDIDECQEQKDLCTHGLCRNTIGSYYCDCDPGYVRAMMDKSCEKHFCPSGWSQFDNTCYFVSNQRTNWTSAREVCEGHGAYLVTLDSEMENKAVSTFWRNSRLALSGNAWIGLSKDPRDETLWLWSDGFHPKFTNWMYGDPGSWIGRHSCIYMGQFRNNVGKWGNTACTSNIGFVCEKKAAPTFKYHKQMKRTKLQFMEGDDMTLSCDAIGNPKPTIEWYLNDKPLKGIIPGRHDYELSIKAISTKEEGKYTCNVTNAFGSLSFTYKTTVRELPCGGVLWELSGEISTPNYPQPYPDNATCVWRIPGSSSHVNLTFSDFELENSVDCYYADYFEVRQRGKNHRRICGSRDPWVWVLTTNGSDLELLFHSDTTLPFRGFKLRYLKYEKTGLISGQKGGNELCGGQLTEPSGEITSPNFPQSYPTNVTCTWRIQNQESAHINLTFLEFELEGSPLCKDFDYVELLDVHNNPLTRMCGSRPPQTIVLPVNGADLNVVFHSDASLISKGFKLRYTRNTAPTFRYHKQMKRTKLQFMEGDDVTLSCDAIGNPKPTIEWYLNDKPLKGIIPGRHYYELSIKAISTKEEGKYTCNVTNAFGSLSFAYKTTVRELPCGGVLWKLSSEISTPNYPLPYPDNVTCIWRIPGSSSHVNLTFSDFELENSVDCYNADYFEVRQRGKNHRRICGSRDPWVWVLTTNGSDLELVFHSDTTLPFRGFKLRYLKYEKTGLISGQKGGNELCGGQLTEPSGEITSPNFPQSYPTNVTCTWRIQNQESAHINLTFLEFELEGSPLCKDFDYVELLDVHNNPLTRMCGSRPPQTIVLPVNGADLNVVFHSDASLISKGFKLRYTRNTAPTFRYHKQMKRTKLQFMEGDDVTLSCDAIGNPKPTIEWYLNDKPLKGIIPGRHYYELSIKAISTKEEGKYTCNVTNAFGSLSFAYKTTVRELPCGGVLWKLSSEISTPNYPLPYPDNVTCIWRIPGSSSHVNLTFSDFELENSVDCYNADYFEVRQRGKNHRRICGSRDPWVWVLTTNGSDLELVFHSDTTLPFRGFKLRYLKYEKTGRISGQKGGNELCGGELTEPSGEITSPNYPQSYPTNVTCTWRIQNQESAQINLTFLEFELEGSPLCKDFDYVELLDVHNNALTRMCGSRPPQTIVLPVNGADLNVVFHSDASLTSKGFKLRYTRSRTRISCANFKCSRKYGICVMETSASGEPQPTCVCPSCPRGGRRVCGSDGFVYSSRCVLQRTSCLLGQEIDTVSLVGGHCIKRLTAGSSITCANFKCSRKYGICVMETTASGEPRPKCACPSCPHGGVGVCGSDGYRYGNLCKLQRTACLLGEDIEEAPKHGGVCMKPTLAPVSTSSPVGTAGTTGPRVDRCVGFKCYNKLEVCVLVKDTPKCACPVCPLGAADQVCGSDGHKYTSLCDLEQTACRLGIDIKAVPAVNGKCHRK